MSIPDSLIGLDPLFSATWKLFIRDILRCPEHDRFKGYFVYKNHLFSSIEICGLITQLDFRSHATLFSVDDGTGELPCIVWPRKGLNIEDNNIFAIGKCISIRGKLSLNRNEHQLTFKHLDVNNKIDAESLFAKEVETLKREVYDKPWNPPKFLLSKLNSLETFLKDTNRNEPQSKPTKPCTSIFVEPIFRYLNQSEQVDFSAEDLLQDKKIEEIIIDTANVTISFVLIKKIISIMVQEGYIFETSRFSGLYNIIPEENLIGSIYQVFNHKDLESVKISTIKKTIDSLDPRCIKIPEYRYQKIIKGLEEEGLIYESSHEHYKLA